MVIRRSPQFSHFDIMQNPIKHQICLEMFSNFISAYESKNRRWHTNGNRTLRAWGRSALRHFGTVHVGRKCPDISASVPKDTSDRTIKLPTPMVRTVPPYGLKCPTLWSEMSHHNFVVYVACSPTSLFQPRMLHAIVY